MEYIKKIYDMSDDALLIFTFIKNYLKFLVNSLDN